MATRMERWGKTWHSGRPSKTYKEVKALFAEKGYILLSKKYINSKSPLEYKCKAGHIRTTNWNLFSRGYVSDKCFCCQREGSQLKTDIRKSFRAKHYSLQEVARELGVDYEELRQAVNIWKLLPAPTHKVAGFRKFYYSKADLTQLRKLIEVVDE